MRLLLPVCCLCFAVIVSAGKITPPSTTSQKNINEGRGDGNTRVEEDPDSTPQTNSNIVGAGKVTPPSTPDQTNKNENAVVGNTRVEDDPDSAPIINSNSGGKTVKRGKKAIKDLHNEISDKKKLARKTTLDRQLSNIREDLEEMSTSERNTQKETMLNELREIHNQRMRLRMLIGGYSFAQMVLNLGQFIPVLNIYLATGAKGINMIKDWLIQPLDESFQKHQIAYANAVAHFLEKYPEYRKGYTRLPSHLKIKMNDGGELDLRVLKQTETEDLPETSLHLANKGPIELATMVMQMK